MNSPLKVLPDVFKALNGLSKALPKVFKASDGVGQALPACFKGLPALCQGPPAPIPAGHLANQGPHVARTEEKKQHGAGRAKYNSRSARGRRREAWAGLAGAGIQI